MKVEIICPLYNAENYIENLHDNILKQKNVDFSVRYLLTESTDKTESILKSKKLIYDKVEKKDFSHSLTRELAARNSKANIIVFISQDVEPSDENWLYYLVKDIIDGSVSATYSRQITKFNNLEKYTREKNYPKESKIVSKDDINDLGLKAFFFSDAASAIKKEVFEQLNYYDNKRLPINEDMYIAHKLITNGYKIKYCSDSIVYHSHNFKLKELFNRYKLTGQFFKENSYLDEYGTTDSGIKLAMYVLKRVFQEGRILLLFRYPFDMGARFIGMKAGNK